MELARPPWRCWEFPLDEDSEDRLCGGAYMCEPMAQSVVAAGEDLARPHLCKNSYAAEGSVKFRPEFLINGQETTREQQPLVTSCTPSCRLMDMSASWPSRTGTPESDSSSWSSTAVAATVLRAEMVEPAAAESAAGSTTTSPESADVRAVAATVTASGASEAVAVASGSSAEPMVVRRDNAVRRDGVEWWW